MTTKKILVIAIIGAIAVEAILWTIILLFGHFGGDGVDSVGSLFFYSHIIGFTVVDKVLRLSSPADIVGIVVSGLTQFFIVFWIVLLTVKTITWIVLLTVKTITEKIKTEQNASPLLVAQRDKMLCKKDEMRYRILRQVLIGIALIIPVLLLFDLFSVMRYITPGLISPRGDIERLAATYSLGLHVLLFTTSLLPLVPWLWIGTVDRGELLPHCATGFIVTVLAQFPSWCMLLDYTQNNSGWLPLPPDSNLQRLLVFPLCLLCLLVWSLFQASRNQERMPLPARIILYVQYFACAFFAVSTYLAFRWATPS